MSKKAPGLFVLDPAHERMDMFNQQITKDIWRDKYRWGDEKNPLDSFHRVAEAIYKDDLTQSAHADLAMRQGLWVPGGRITAGAGTKKRVTLMNCYVNETLDDSMEGIMRGNTNVALTLQQSGGIGTDFSSLRPSGAVLRRTHSKASGPLPFMRMYDRTSATVRSAGDRRGAMMGTLCDTHPDLPAFIKVKQTAGELTQFNVSILVSDALMEAIREDEEWLLYFSIPPWDSNRSSGLEELDFEDDAGVKQYVYSTWRARELWEMITRATYEFSEPGVIFIDRINDLNNLYYCEEIHCTNPCGEQCLPPHGTCNLGHINLARMVSSPFTSKATLDIGLLEEVTRVGVRFLDNVIDVTQYPLDAQAIEQSQKRRIGLGTTGVADALVQLGLRYGSHQAIQLVERAKRKICLAAYRESVALSKERGPFPLYDRHKYLSGTSFVTTQLPEDVRNEIQQFGIRNSVLLTDAPVGTGSLLFGNTGSGLEPYFDLRPNRKVFQADETWKEYEKIPMYGVRLFEMLYPGRELPNAFVTSAELSVDEHIVMQAAAQRWVDASVSKTANCPEEMTYEEFCRVYDLAYSLGCKGCTTYRPSKVRGSILTKGDSTNVAQSLIDRPDTLQGYTTKIKWPSLKAALYLTVNFTPDRQPFEIFFASKDARAHDWMTSLSLMLTGVFRRGGDISFVWRELQQVESLNDGAIIDQKYRPSLPAYIGDVLEANLSKGAYNGGPMELNRSLPPSAASIELGERCPACSQKSLRYAEGCKTCTSCSFTTCG